MTAVVTVGGALVGILACLPVLVPWWRKGSKGSAAKAGKGPDLAKPSGGSRNIRELTHFGSGLALGILSATCVGGALGMLAHRVGGGANTAGGWLLSFLTGSASPAVNRQAYNHLTPGGAVVLIILLVVLVLVWRASPKRIRRDLGLGYLAGCTLGPTAGLAGLAGYILVPCANTLGGYVVGLL